ncbi:hypothetical protein C0J52_26006, partial [Blattella germanica]
LLLCSELLVVVGIVLLCVVATVTSAAPVFLGSHQFFPTVPYVNPAYTLEIPYPSTQHGLYAAPPVHTGVFSEASRGPFVVFANQQGYQDYPIARSFLPSAPFDHNRNNGPIDGFRPPTGSSAGFRGFQSNPSHGGPRNPEQNIFGPTPSGRQSAGSFSPPGGHSGGPAGHQGSIPGGAPHGLGGPGSSGARGPTSGPVGFQPPNGPGARNSGFGSGDYGPPSGPQGTPGARQPHGPPHQVPGFPTQRDHRSDARPLPGPSDH